MAIIPLQVPKQVAAESVDVLGPMWGARHHDWLPTKKKMCEAEEKVVEPVGEKLIWSRLMLWRRQIAH
jgi:hypothetical protein